MARGVYPKEKRRGMFEKGHKGIKNSGSFKTGMTPWIKNKRHSKESREKMSKSHTGLKHSEEARRKIGAASRGEKSANWKGGVTPEVDRVRHSIEIRLWRESVFARDGWKCQKCGDDRGGNLTAHHISNFSEFVELRFAIDNGITLCSTCHKQFHRVYTQFHNTREQLEQFLRGSE